MQSAIKHTTLSINARKEITLDGVINVEGFDEGFVLLKYDSGKITIEGRMLRIESLSKESGVITVSGEINSVSYDEPKIRSSVFSKLFK